MKPRNRREELYRCAEEVLAALAVAFLLVVMPYLILSLN